jgi:hypothetical protein
MIAPCPGRSGRTGERWLALLTLIVVALTGCSKSTDPTAVVSGKVTLGGAPVTAGTVLFMTDDGQAATAELNADGAYVVNCRPGKFKVSVTPPPPPDPLAAPATQPASTAAQAIPARYRDLRRSGLTIEVKEGENKFDIAMKK